jgi:hypothetical protein
LISSRHRPTETASCVPLVRSAALQVRVPALVYLAELRLRTGDRDAAAALLAEIDALELSGAERAALAADLATAAELAADLG